MVKLHININSFTLKFNLIIFLSILNEAFTDPNSNSKEKIANVKEDKFRPSKMAVCTSDGKSYTFNTNTCKNGAWIPEGIEIECVCVTGLWALSEDYCSNDFQLVAGGRPECFKLNKRIRRIVSLYNRFDKPNAQKNILLRGNLEEHELFDGSIDTKGNEDGAYIIRFNDTENQMYIRHTEGFHDNFWQRCIKPSKKQNLYQIMKVSGITYANNRKGCRAAQDMDFPMKRVNKTVWAFGAGQSWHPIRGVETKSMLCEESCKPKMRLGERTSRQILAGNENVDDEGKEVTEDEVNTYIETLSKKQSSLGNFDSIEEPVYNRSAEPFDQIDRDTSKITNYLRNWNMKREPGPKLPYKAYKYIQYARMILLKTCPKEDVPPVIVTDFLRLYRYVVHEGLKRSPESYSDDTNESAHKRIVSTLEKCYDSAQQIQFSLGSTCPQKVATTTYAGKTVNVALPKNLISNRNTSDIVLETIWKMILHTHYLCSEHFSNNGADLSTMYMKLQEFFTDSAIMFRWEHPLKRTNKIYSILFPSLDFNKFAEGIDACLATAQGVAKYTAWLRRPTSNHQKTSKIMTRKMTQMSARGRSLNSLPTLFDSRGYCTQAFNDPIRWTKFNKEIDAKCVRNSLPSEKENETS